MKIYTSYFSCPLIRRETMHLVQISNSVPKGFVPDGKLEAAVPDWNNTVKPYKDGLIDAIQYRGRYVRQLDEHQFLLHLQLDEIIEAAGGKDVVLICYEKPGDFCHRHILAEYLKSNEQTFQIEVSELTPEEPKLF